MCSLLSRDVFVFHSDYSYYCLLYYIIIIYIIITLFLLVYHLSVFAVRRNVIFYYNIILYTILNSVIDAYCLYWTILRVICVTSFRWKIIFLFECNRLSAASKTEHFDIKRQKNNMKRSPQWYACVLFL